MTDAPLLDRIESRKLAIYGSLLVLPSVFMLSLFAFWPTVATLWASLFSKGTVRRPSQFVGLDNYDFLFSDPSFWQVVGNNLIYAGVTIPVSIGLAMGMALWANARIPARALVRIAYFTPTMLPMVAAANLWLFFYTPDIGVLSRLFGLFGISGINWLGQPETALASIIMVTIWKEAGFFMIFYLAALQTMPLLMPTTLFVMVNALINSVKLIDHLFILTKGGPDNASKLILYWIWEMAFSYFDRPSAAAMTVLVLIVLGVLAVLQFAVLERRIHYR